MAREFERGDRVKSNTPRGETYGRARKRITSQARVNGRKVNASDEAPATSSRARRVATRPPTDQTRRAGREEAGPANDDRQQIVDELDDTVNTARKELEGWLETGESKGRESGRRMVGIQEKNESDYTDDDIDQMRRVVSHVRRDQPRKPSGDTGDSTR